MMEVISFAIIYLLFELGFNRRVLNDSVYRSFENEIFLPSDLLGQLYEIREFDDPVWRGTGMLIGAVRKRS